MADTDTSTGNVVRVESPPGGRFDRLDRFFKISERGSSVRIEIVAGITTWLTMAYILFVNPAILGFVGIPDLQPLGLPFAQVLTVTALVAGVMTILMGVVANYPFALAAGLGLNAFVAFTLVAANGLSFPQAMGVIVVEGVIITILVLTGVREAVLQRDPDGPQAGDRDRHRGVHRADRARERGRGYQHRTHPARARRRAHDAGRSASSWSGSRSAPRWWHGGSRGPC